MICGGVNNVFGKYRIYDNENEAWYGISFEDFEDAEDHVTYILCDADMKRYSIYKLICGN